MYIKFIIMAIYLFRYLERLIVITFKLIVTDKVQKFQQGKIRTETIFTVNNWKNSVIFHDSERKLKSFKIFCSFVVEQPLHLFSNRKFL